MSRHPDYSRDYYSRPSSSSRNWSEEAVRGSWESSYQRSTAASPRDRNSSWRGATPPDYSARAGMVDNWLGTQRTHDPSRPMSTVPEFATPDSSPVISDGSATFQTRPTYGHSPAISDGSATFQSRPVYGSRPVDRTPVVPPDYYTSSPSRTTWRPSPGQGSSSRGATSHSHSTHNSVDYDLRGVGSFADGDRSRRSKDVKYKPLSNWFDLWLP
ncbi:hypothetical protein B0J13DRAFT_26179 [Dactylonectria estremocensis]|uniref:Uncharacterized protein n=1 Tax=Dactylonectria estremocensis TaxID=1079267 RepID=A0A9P9JIT2_9HYPO|nr:hypothetical protein B0J13DRAFT_26179 [Dactylonectria estremocensis]